MSNTPALIKQADLTRFAKAMQAAGVEEWRLILPDGTQIVVGKPDDAAQATDAWDARLK